MIAERLNPATAQDFMDRQNIALSGDARNWFAAIQSSAAVLDDPSKLADLLTHFDDDAQPHHFCAHMQIFPVTLWRLVETGRINSDQAVTTIRKVITQISDYICPSKTKSSTDPFFVKSCHCIQDKMSIIAQLLGVLFYVDSDQAEDLWNELPSEPYKAYALKQAMTHLGPTEERIERIMKVAQAMIQDSNEQALFFYEIARGLKVEMALTIAQLIALADSIVPAKLTHTMSVYRAQAQIRQITSAEHFTAVHEALATMKTFVQLRDKVALLQPIIQNAQTWPPEKQQELLCKIVVIIKEYRIEDVHALIIACIPLLHMLSDDESISKLFERIEWAHQM
jgi:hypothetical protein